MSKKYTIYQIKNFKEIELQDGGERMKILDEIMNDKINFFQKYNQICGSENYIPAILGKVPRIVVFGDIHGDLQLAKDMLKIAGVVKEKHGKLEWIGGNTYVVQVGDQVDRCRPVGNMICSNPLTTQNDEHSDIKILKLYTKLHLQAKKFGGAVISLLGNHELMNSMGQMDYVSYQGLKGFESYVPKNNQNITFPDGEAARKYAFAPGNEYGTFLGCTRVPAIIIGSNLFVHAGLVDGLIREIGLKGIDDFESINIAIRKWLLGMLDIKYVNNIINGSKYSMFWTRILGNIPSNTSINNPVCSSNIGKVLKMFKIGSIIVGHTPQSFTHSDDINGTCSQTVWRVDNASSAAFNNFDRKYMMTGEKDHGRRIQYLEIINDTIYKVCDANGCK